jgi:hypothetical protein
MTYNKMVNGEIIPMTEAEIAARQAEEAAFEAARPMREWQAHIATTDAKLPRYAEDIIDAMSSTDRARIAKETLDAYNEKKQIRNEKPETAR